MQKIKYTLLALTIFIVLGSMSILAEEECNIEIEEVHCEQEYQFSHDFKPIIAFNPIREWSLGGQLSLSGLCGSDTLIGFYDYSFSKKNSNIGLEYVHYYNQHYYVGDVFDILEYKGIYGNEPYWQHTQGATLGVIYEKHWPENYFYVDLKSEYRNLKPGNSPGGYIFESGKYISIMPSVFGNYQGYIGKLQVFYGVPLKNSDFDYIKVDALLKKGFEITKTGDLIVSAEVGALRGNYPAQQKFYLGSSVMNITPNFKSKMLGILNSFTDSFLMLPNVRLDGFEDNVFDGENMYVTKIEYLEDIVSLENIANLCGKVYVMAGNAWTGEFTKGFEKPKAAIGIGLYLEIEDVEHESREVGFGINLAHGFGEKSAFTLGFEIGVDFQLLTNGLLQ